MKRNIIFIVLMFLLCFVYIKGMNFYDTHKSRGSKPSIDVDASVLTVSVKDPTSVLLKGVKANDEEDGDISSSVIIESISDFDENMQRTINYAVFDSDGNVSRMVRSMRYSDYSKPIFKIEKAMIVNNMFYSKDLLSYVSASSSIDGDISSNIKVKEFYEGNEDYKPTITYEVSDSCKMKVEFTLNVTLVNKVISNEIKLSTYEVSLPAGTRYFNARSYIESISGPLGDLSRYINQVNINDNVNYDVPGTYDIVYTYTSDDDSFGATKLLVTIY